MKLRQQFLRFSALIAIGVSQAVSAFAGGEPCGCLTNQISINTGINHSTMGIIAPGNYDPMWTVVTAPTSASLATPANAYVIAAPSYWAQSTPALQSLINSTAGWLSPFNSASYNVNNPSPQNPFEFKFEFCVCQSADYKITATLGGDDFSDVTLDGNASAFLTNPGWSTATQTTYNVYLTAGTHYLKIRLRNLGGSVMGTALTGTIQSFAGNTLIGHNCCKNVGGISGKKYEDVNCNGQLDAADQPLPNWTFTLNPGNYTATTDAIGAFHFTNVPPGTYTLAENLQAGWTPVLPNAAGSTQITVTANSVATINFLNAHCNPPQDPICDLECFWRVTGNNTINPAINYIGTNTNADFIIKTNSQQRAVIEGTGDGNMGIATGSPTTILHVYSAPPPTSGAPSGLRFENLPAGYGNILVVDQQGYVYVAQNSVADKQAGNNSTSSEAQQMDVKIKELQQEIAALKSLLSDMKSGDNSLSVSPNPTTGQVSATFRIASAYTTANIRITDNAGKTVMSNALEGSNGTLTLTLPATVAPGSLICALIVDGKLVATQKLVLVK